MYSLTVMACSIIIYQIINDVLDSIKERELILDEVEFGNNGVALFVRYKTVPLYRHILYRVFYRDTTQLYGVSKNFYKWALV